MNTTCPSLHHIAIRTEQLNKTVTFYSKILGLINTGEFSVKDTSALLKYSHSLLVHAPRKIHQFTRERFTSGYQMMNAMVCQLGTGGPYYELLIVQEEDPKTKMVLPLSGSSLYGLAFVIRDEIHPDILAWDLEIAGVPFRIGDSYSSGLKFTPGNERYSLYLTDPDGRVVELIPSGSCSQVTPTPLIEAETGIPLVSGLSHLMVYVSDTKVSSRFYQDLGLIAITSQGEDIPALDSDKLYLGDEKKNIRIILMQKYDENGLPLPAGGDGIDHLGFCGFVANSCETLKNPACITISQEKERDDEDQKMSSCQYLSDPDGYLVEICQE